jgi:hypothetical protein
MPRSSCSLVHMNFPRSILVAAVSFALVTFPAPVDADYEFSEDAPRVLVRVPVPCPPDRTPLHYVVLVGGDGFVRATRLRQGSETNAEADWALRHWIFQPPPLLDGDTIQVWVAVGNDRACLDSTATKRRLLERPDARLLSRLRVADKVIIGVKTRPLPADFGQRFVRLLSRSRAYAGPPPRTRSCTPDDLSPVALRGGGWSGVTTFELSRKCDFLQIESPEVVLQVPFASVRSEMLALMDELVAITRDPEPGTR